MNEPPLRMPRILVVDDNPVNAKLAGILLEAAGYGVLVAEDAADALARIAQQPPDLILMDLQLPGMDGLTLTRRLKADSRLGSIPIVALTASATRGDEAKALEAGCDDYIAKPIDTRTFARRIGEILQARRR
jgi:CheY-like chemotaxis protein